MMPYSDLLLTENDDRNKAYSCCLECSLGFIDYSKQPDNNYKHVFVYQDDVTKFTILKPLKEKKRDEISHCLLEIFSLIGVPAKIYTREKSLVKSVFNTTIRNFCQNFSTKIKQPKNGTFEETECCKFDEKIKEWMKHAMSAEWSQGLYFVQFQNNCYFNEAINATPFNTFLKPSYTYSRRKYTRYLFRKRDHEQILDTLFLNHSVCISNQEREQTSQFLEKSRQQMKEKIISSKKEHDEGTNILKANYLSSKDCLEILRNDFGIEMLHVKHRGKITNLEHGKEIKTLNELSSDNKVYEKMFDNIPEKKYEMIQKIYSLLKNECGQVKEYNLNKLRCLNKQPSSIGRELSKEEKQNDCEKNVSILHQIIDVLENDSFDNVKPEKYDKNESYQESSLIKFLDNHSDSVNLCEESWECNKKIKYNKGKNLLENSDNSSYCVLSLGDHQKDDVTTAKLKHDDNDFVGNNLNEKHNVYNYENTYSTKFDNNVPLRNESSKIYSESIGASTSKVDWLECVDNNHLDLNESHLTLPENNVKAKSVRFANDPRLKHPVCSICKKKKRHKASLNSLNKHSLAIGSTVRVRVPVTERLKGYPNYILATITEEKDRMYKVATPRGVLKEMFKRDQLHPCNDFICGTRGSPAEPTKTLKCHLNPPVNRKLNKHTFKKK
ncbi:uncharacterized protein [Halyomorpha halys]